MLPKIEYKDTNYFLNGKIYFLLMNHFILL